MYVIAKLNPYLDLIKNAYISLRTKFQFHVPYQSVVIFRFGYTFPYNRFFDTIVTNKVVSCKLKGHVIMNIVIDILI